MINRIKARIEAMAHVDGWKIVEIQTTSNELFYIQKDVDMNRKKDVTHYEVTLYKDFEEGGQKYKGSSKVSLSPGMSQEEMDEILQEALYAASFVKNKWYPLAPAHQEISSEGKDFLAQDTMPLMTEMAKAIYADHGVKAQINSAEIFMNRSIKRMMNANGLDVSFPQTKGEIEVVTDHKGATEDVELFEIMNFSDISSDKLKERVKHQLKMTEERAGAQKAPSLKGINVLIGQEACRDFFGFYLTHAGAQAVYERISAAKLKENFQGKEIKGDKVNIDLIPEMAHSAHSAPFDADGVKLSDTVLYQDGVLQNYYGSLQYTSYLEAPPVGHIRNFRVQTGHQSEGDLKKAPYVEILSFSAFQMDPITGDFGGEFRLAEYFDGEKVRYISGGALSANVFEVQQEMYFSKEETQLNYYQGPKLIMFPKMEIAGA